MNVFGNRERSRRKARKRGVSPIIATILLVAITVMLAAVLYVLISGLTSGGANTVPIGTTFAFGTAQQTSTLPTGATACPTTPPAGECYSIGIQSAGSSATTSNIHFGVLKSGSGTTFTAVDVVSSAGSVIASYTQSTGKWTSTITNGVPLTLDSTMTLMVGYTATIEGASLEAIGVGSLSGSTTVALP